MNGTISTLQDEIKKNLSTQSKEKFKFIMVVLLSNLFVALLCFSFMDSSDKSNELIAPQKASQKGHQYLVVPVSSLLIEETPVSSSQTHTLVDIYSPDNKLLAQKALIKEFIKSESGLRHFKFEIKSEDIINFKELREGGVLVVPYVPKNELSKTKSLVKKTKGSLYEVDY